MRIGSHVIVLTVALLAACAPDDARQPDTDAIVADSGAAAEPAGHELFVQQPDAGAQLVFVGPDSAVRPADHRDAVFVPMSTFSVVRGGIPNEFPEPDSLAALLRAAGVGSGPVVIIGDPIPAGRAYAAFDYLGLGDRASVLDGGTAAFASVATGTSASQAPVRHEGGAASVDSAAVSDSVAPSGGSGVGPTVGGGLVFDAREDMIVDAEWVHTRLNDTGVAILDARPPAEFSGETPGEGIDRPGHIPGARNVFWQTLVQSAESPILRDEAELRRIFEAAGAQPGDTIVAYCRTGGQASFLYTVARHLGYHVRLYDGSFIDWSRTDYPVER